MSQERSEKRERNRLVQELLQTSKYLPDTQTQEQVEACCESKKIRLQLTEENSMWKVKLGELESKNHELSALIRDQGIIREDQLVAQIKQRLKEVLSENQID